MATKRKKVILLSDICNIQLYENDNITILSDNELSYNTSNFIKTITFNNIIITNKERCKKYVNLKYIYYYLLTHKHLLEGNINDLMIPIISADMIDMIVNVLDTVYTIIETNNNSIISYEQIKKSIIVASTMNKCTKKKLDDIILSKPKNILDKYISYYIQYNPSDIIIVPLKRVQKHIIKECEYWDNMILQLNNMNNKIKEYYVL